MLPDGDRRVRLRRGYVDVRNGKLAEVQLGEPILPAEVGGSHAIIAPGFIDAHLHLPQFDSIGRFGMPLLDWLERVIFPAEARWADADFAEDMTRRVLDLILGFGTTSFSAFATSHHEATQRAIRVVGNRGLRALVGQVLMDRNAPDGLIDEPERQVRRAARLTPVGRCSPIVTPRFAITCSQELLGLAAWLSRKLDQPIQTHLAETPEECEQVRRLFGAGYVRVYQEAGLLTARSILAHGVCLDDDDRAALAGAGATVAHCPTANRFLASGSMDLRAMRSAGVGVALGSDVAGGPDRSMVRVARAMIETARSLGHEPPAAAEAFWQITAGNAVGLGFHDVGTLANGRRADLLVIEPDVHGSLPGVKDHDPLETLLWAWDDRWIKRVYVGGQLAWRAGGLA